LTDGTAETALALSAVYSCVRLLAESVAALPLCVYRDTGSRRVRVTSSSLFDQPAAYGTPFDWIYQLMTSLLTYGNAYGLVTSRDGFGFPTNIEWLRTEFVSVQEDPGYNPMLAKWFYLGRELNREDLVHVRAFTLPGRILGLSPIKQFASTIASGLASLQYGNDWFANGGVPPATFKNSQRTVDPKASAEITQRLTAAIRSRQPLVHGNDWDFKAMTVPPDEVQFLGSMKLNATQIAAIYDVPPERAGGEPGGSLTYATQEQDQIRLAVTTGKWCTRLEHAFYGLLPERQYTRFNVDAMIRTDTKTRHEVFKLDRDMGLKSIDELREIDDLEPLPNGEGADYSPLAVTVAEASAAAKPAPADPAQPSPIRAIS
jgi:HK97 family phage portal protein